jgi:oligo-1,6-glucosidase
MNEKVLSKYDLYTVGEGGVIPFSKVEDYVGTDRNELSTLYSDEIGNIWGRDKDSLDYGEYNVKAHNVTGIKKIVSKWDNKFLTNGWNTVFFANHDQSRTVSRFGNDAPEYIDASAKMLYTFLLTQRATPYLYNGDEIGMTNIRFKNVEQYNDLQTRNRYYIELKKSKAAGEAYLAMQAELSRDNGRTPMQWDATALAGFTTGKPWLPINSNTTNVNVALQDKDKNSVLNYVRTLTKLRKEHKDVLVYGKYNLLDADNKNIFAYTRSNGKETFLVLMNFTKDVSSTPIPKGFSLGDELINNLQPLKLNGDKIVLQPYQAGIVKLK